MSTPRLTPHQARALARELRGRGVVLLVNEGGGLTIFALSKEARSLVSLARAYEQELLAALRPTGVPCRAWRRRPRP
jgi:hypothetical protein